MSDSDNETLLTADDLADRWRLPKNAIYRLSREGKIPNLRIGKYLRYRLDAIEAWERDNAQSPPPQN